MKINHLIEYVIFEIVALIAQSLPLKTVQAVGAWVGEFFFVVLGYRREKTMENLRRAFPEKKETDREKIARGAFRNVGTSLFELLWLPLMDLDFVRRLCKAENLEAFNQAKARGKGAIIVTAHFGNWELIGPAVLAHTGCPLLMIVKTQANGMIDKNINAWRTKIGNKVISMESSVREVLRALQNGDIVGIAADQSAPEDSVPIEFFGRTVPTFEGPATFSLRSGAPMVGVFTIRQSDGTYVVRFEEVDVSDVKGDHREKVVELTKRHVQMTEAIIRKYPDQWMWMHKRWKHAVVSNSSSLQSGLAP